MGNFIFFDQQKIHLDVRTQCWCDVEQNWVGNEKIGMEFAYQYFLETA
jgi:hypothetical protein